jgi:caffeoyl-CoA O-methyltransferase
MVGRSVEMTEQLYDYIKRHTSGEDPLLAELAAETRKLGGVSGMQIDSVQGAFMALLVRATGARSALELGTFTGYSAICVARALPSDGRLLCCDVSQEWTAIARRYWERAGLTHKITLKLAPALETLRALPPDTSFDFTFIDADKEQYPTYYEEVLKRTRPNGLIVLDNVLQRGQVAETRAASANLAGIRAVNDLIARDERVDAVMLPLADGITIVRKK